MPFVVKTEPEIINEILIEIVTNIDDVTDVNVGSVLRKLVEALGIEIKDLYDQLEVIYAGTRIDTATGTDLDNLAALLGITRKAGTKSQSDVTFIRRTPIGSDFTIPVSAIIATQPNTGEEQLRYLVDANTTFSAIVTDEDHTFRDGTYFYAANERFIDSITQITGLVLGSAYTFAPAIDYQLTKDYAGLIIDPDSIVDVDTCESIAGWANSADAAAPILDNADYKQGTGSIKLGKTGAVTDEFYYAKTLGSLIDATNLNLYLWIKVADAPTLNKLQEIRIMMGSGGSLANSYELSLDQTNLVIGWNRYKIDFGDAQIVKTGLPNKSAMNYLRITGKTNLAADTIASGDLKMDWWLVGTSEDYEGDIVEWIQGGTMPDEATTYKVSYVPLSKEVLCSSEFVGVKYNVGKGKIVYKVSYIANVDSIYNYDMMRGGTDVEDDDDLRDRVKNATELKGKATAEALRQAVLAVEGVTSCSVNDMPPRTSSAENHYFISYALSPTQKLDYEVAQIDGTLAVSGTVSAAPYTFVHSTDFYLQDTVVVWVPTATNPDPTTWFASTYNYRWLGHVEMFVTGTSTPLPSDVADNIDDAIADTKAAGVVVTWAEPTIITVNINTNILVDTANGYAFASVEEDVRDALIIHMNSLESGQDVYRAKLIDVIMTVPGVLNTVINLPAADVTIATDEVARVGSITIGSL